ncbi:MAG: calcium-transporting P-type ATPase, PMR1-type [Candidatus Aenigmatarchaeota archaeon]
MNQTKWHIFEAEDVMKILESSENGLSEQEAKQRLEKFGLNEIKEKKRISPLKIFLRQFKSFLIGILLVAAIVSFFLKEFLDASAIFAILMMNAFLGFYQEYKAEKAMESLKKMMVQKVKVIREGKQTEISSKELVPGDIIILEEGEGIPADARIIEAFGLATDESALTGESTPVEKQVKPIQDLPIAERNNMVFMGTYVARGRGKAIVVATGMNTEVGKIAKEIEEAEEETPLQKKLDKFGKWLGLLVLVVCFFVFVLGYLEDLDIVDDFFTAVALAVSAVPEGLPAVVTVALALGVNKMAKRNALVRKLSAVETLGCTTVIAADKTGTMTVNEMCVKKIWCSGKIVEVSGTGFEPRGEFFSEGMRIEPTKNKDLMLLIKAGLLCNNSTLEFKEGKWHVVGDPTEAALLVLASKAGLAKQEKAEFEIPFSSERKLMTVVYKQGKEFVAFTKGAPEKVLQLSTYILKKGKTERLSEKEKVKISFEMEEMAKQGFRVLALAYKRVKKIEESKLEKDLTFLGFVGMIDPPRPEVKQAIETCKQAGIRVVMITGDHKLTALAVAKEIGLVEGEEEVLTGEELEKMSEEELEEKVEKVTIYARVSPQHKSRIVKALKKKGHIVAVTGDGINDAPALKKSDIGVAMGIKGTDVAKEASDMVLLDDNFATIVNAVEEGRGIYDNIRKFVRFLLCLNFDEIALITTAIILSTMLPNLPLPLLPLQILWLNLLTDGLPALAITADPYEEDLMKKKPRNPKHGILHGMLPFILMATLVNFISTFTIFIWSFNSGYSPEKIRTMVFTTAVFFELFFVFNCRSENKSVFKKGFLDNKKLLVAVLISFLLQLLAVYHPFFQQIFKTVALGPKEFFVILAMSSLGLLVLPEIFMNRDLKFRRIES